MKHVIKTIGLFFAIASIGILKSQQLPKKQLIHEYELGLGKKDSFFTPHFKRFQKLFASKYSLILTPPVGISLQKLDALYRQVYVRNKQKDSAENQTKRIPKIIHQVWLGSPLPERYKKWCESWMNLGSDWQYKLWTDADVAQFPMINRAMYDHAKNWGAKSDILRMEILNTVGGIYVDIDFECTDSAFFDAAVGQYDLFCSMHPIDCPDYLLQNALIGSVPGHPVVQGYIKELPRFYYRDYKDVVKATGPGMFTWAFFSYEKDAQKRQFRDIVFPPSVLFPLGFVQAQTFSGKTQDYIKQCVLKKDSAAIHWWEGSWH